MKLKKKLKKKLKNEVLKTENSGQIKGTALFNFK